MLTLFLFMKSFACPTCGRVFNRSQKLDDHARIHTGERPYVCKVEGCGKCFTRESHLRRHMTSHQEVRPFSCTFEGCNKSFKYKDALKKHMRKHIIEKPYKCSFCSETFEKPSHLERHKIIHTGGFVCTVEGCQAKPFCSPFTLLRHIQTKHQNDKRYLCPIPHCGCIFGKISEMKQHIEDVHEKQKSSKQVISCMNSNDEATDSLTGGIKDSNTNNELSQDSDEEELDDDIMPIKSKIKGIVQLSEEGKRPKKAEDISESQEEHLTESEAIEEEESQIISRLPSPLMTPSLSQSPLFSNADFCIQCDALSTSSTANGSSTQKAIDKLPLNPIDLPSSIIVPVVHNISRTPTIPLLEHLQISTSSPSLSSSPHPSTSLDPLPSVSPVASSTSHSPRTPRTRQRSRSNTPIRQAFACNWPDCNKQFSSQSNLIKHIHTTHLKLHSYVCLYPKCYHRFSHKHNLVAHHQTAHQSLSSSKAASVSAASKLAQCLQEKIKELCFDKKIEEEEGKKSDQVEWKQSTIKTVQAKVGETETKHNQNWFTALSNFHEDNDDLPSSSVSASNAQSQTSTDKHKEHLFTDTFDVCVMIEEGMLFFQSQKWKSDSIVHINKELGSDFSDNSTVLHPDNGNKFFDSVLLDLFKSCE
ncbi:putative transcription factor IIIA [Monocercomonoides exilis]|uniref:putative transcription factor IIIA n=1 Tax=Monocercomonoides exilis TaxID=2049356 RepID=UPI0035598C4B|nr:putative transcription factor IIIA [Monocercomonoides exilis]|eukprot:MONOS_6703.1-p1 / transcript=MONOS_6703.1 / gene=MONOS_6703 / organism=Monocercomonoides_exilis_PA203 / gene_product=transcription factor IIIA / transcript_product=transcription factor IIIA / location=Mono_scaffold00216:22487-24988(-) / protein_length=644 / sequence_SO=supercontig / SO=protein_coding / is_pseudo=false